MVKGTEKESKDIVKLKSAVVERLKKLKGLPNDMKVKKNSDIKSMINRYVELTNSVEDRRVRIHTFSLQVLAISVAALTLLVSSDKVSREGVLFYVGVVIFVLLIGCSLWTSYLYVRQSGFRYPFLSLEEYGENKWKWFYYGNKSILKIDANPLGSVKSPSRRIIPYLEGLRDFVEWYTDETLNKEITDNVQQLYLLQVHNYYKNQFYLQLTKVWQMSLRVILVVIGIGFVLWLWPYWEELLFIVVEFLYKCPK